MPRKKLPYKPGDLFAVPLPCGGFGVGLVARMDGKGIVLGYFFGPRRDDLPRASDVGEPFARDSIEIAMFGHLGLIGGRWPIIGPLPNWNTASWPVPIFGRIDVLSGKRAWRVRYDDRDLKWLSDEEVEVDEARTLPRDRLMGAGAVETWLARVLDCDRIPGADPRSITPTLV
jgi:hypothetical protein